MITAARRLLVAGFLTAAAALACLFLGGFGVAP